VFHRVLCVSFGLKVHSGELSQSYRSPSMTHLVHFEPEVQQEQRRNDSETERDSPHRVEVVHPKDPETD